VQEATPWLCLGAFGVRRCAAPGGDPALPPAPAPAQAPPASVLALDGRLERGPQARGSFLEPRVRCNQPGRRLLACRVRGERGLARPHGLHRKGNGTGKGSVSQHCVSANVQVTARHGKSSPQKLLRWSLLPQEPSHRPEAQGTAREGRGPDPKGQAQAQGPPARAPRRTSESESPWKGLTGEVVEAAAAACVKGCRRDAIVPRPPPLGGTTPVSSLPCSMNSRGASSRLEPPCGSQGLPGTARGRGEVRRRRPR